MVLGIRITSNDIRPFITKRIRALRNKKPLFLRIGKILKDSVDRNFNEEGTPRWIDLRKSTRLQRVSRGFSEGPKLKRTGRLYKSIKVIERKDYVQVATNSKYGKLQQFGGVINHPGGTKYGFNQQSNIRFRRNTTKKFIGITRPHTIKIPARPFIKLTDNDFNSIMEIVKSYVSNGE